MPAEAITALTALIGAVGGGLGVTWVTGYFSHKGKLLDDGEKMRVELWDEIHDLRTRIDTLTTQNETCQRENAMLRGQVEGLQVENRNLQRDFGALKAQKDTSQ